MLETEKIFLEEKARIIRKHIISMLGEAGSGHPGGSLSAADIVAALFFHHMNIDPARPHWEHRDRFILSKGHAAPVLYAALAEAGFFDTKELKYLRKTGHMLQGHPDMKSTPGVEISTGSLGQGLAVGNGMALAAKLDGRDYRVFVLMGDGEIQEGMIWEAAMAAAHYKLDNLVGILDYNGLQIDGPITQVMNPEPIVDKWKAFGWHVIVIDGHDFEEIISALEQADRIEGKPTLILAKTIKGKGVSFMENQVDWHGKAPSKEEMELALKELSQGEVLERWETLK
ncbi:MAG: Transketolase domain protein [Clostridia bacterium 41_269]|nr:MAG: Transketolase domain protein [Clostridia bacterium 41_269]